MQIQLKQSEIIQALKLYISTQGINLNGKTVEVAFTAGRKETGLSADIDIQDAVPATAPNMAYPCEVAPVASNREEMIAALRVASEAIDHEAADMEEAVVWEEVAPVVKGASLFG